MQQVRELVDEAITRQEALEYQESNELLTQAIHLAETTEEDKDIYLCSDLFLRRCSNYRELGDLDLALKDADKSLEFRPQSIVALNIRALVLENAIFDKKDDALKDFSEALSIEPNAVIYCNRGQLLEDEYFGRYKEALADFTAAIELNPSYITGYMNRAELYSEKLGEPLLALQDMDAAVRLEPSNCVAYNRRALVLMYKLQRFNEALKDINKALEINPTYAIGYFNRALLMDIGFKEYHKAVEDYGVCMKLNPTFAKTYNNRGAVYRDELHEYDKAFDDFEKAIQLNPNYAAALANKAHLHYLRQQYTEARQLTMKALNIDKKIARAWLVLGFIMFKEGNYLEGRKCFAEFKRLGHWDVTFLKRALAEIQTMEANVPKEHS